MMKCPEQPALPIFQQTIPSYIGPITLMCNDIGLTHLKVAIHKTTLPNLPTHPILQAAAEALNCYFENPASENFHRIPLDLSSLSPYHSQVLSLVREISTGQTLSYLQLAHKMGGPTHTRAVANANARNPIPIIIPCHRVIGTNGSLTGYALGLPIKKWLLDHENPYKQLQLQF